jgi:NADPH:quinone reductase-like Zn-dependent oxidoreductase
LTGAGALRLGRLCSGGTVLVTAGAGAIGHLAVQLARQLGAGTVIATAGSAAKLGFVKELGADVAVNHTEPDWAAQVRLAAPGGVDVVLEAVGGETLHKGIALLAPFGRAVIFGASAGDLTSIPVTSLFQLKTASGFSLLAWRSADPARPAPTSPNSPACSRRERCAPSQRRHFRWPRRSRHTGCWKNGRCSAGSS